MNKTILITGATGALGGATAVALAQRGNVHLILAGRTPAKLAVVKAAVQATNHGVPVDTLPLDLSNPQSVRSAIADVKAKYSRLDALVNAAAVYKTSRTLTGQGHEMMFATNHLGPFQLTTGLLDLLRAAPGAKVLTVSAPSSTKLDFTDLDGEKKFGALTAFGASKMMNLLFAFQLARRLEGSGLASMAFHPGLLRSELLNEAPAALRWFLRLVSSPPQKAAASIAELLLDGDGRQQNGKFYTVKEKEMKPAAYATVTANQERLWQLSEKLVG